MFQSIRNYITYVLLFIVLTGVPATVTDAKTLALQDRAIHQTIRFARGTSSAFLNKRILRGTSHVYHLRARRGQYMTVILKTGENTSFSIYSIRTGQIDGADGVQDWDGKLPETGEYIIEIGTDVSTNYELTVTVE